MKHAFLALAAVLLLASCDDAEDGTIYGYAEGRFRLLAPESEGRIVDLMVAEGDEVEAGATIARLDDSIERAKLDEAEARAKAAAARFKDASLGGRDAEIKAARELLAQAEATAEAADDELGRVQPLFERGVVSRSRLDAAEAEARAADARVSELKERLTLVELPARENALHALQADADAADAAVAAARQELARRTVATPEAGLVERLLREPGESAGPAAPILRFLPRGAMMAIGYVPEAQLGGFAPGDRLAVACDSCPASLFAVVTSVSKDAAFTSPMIFSDTERARLVFRMEARFEGAAPPSGTPLQLRRP